MGLPAPETFDESDRSAFRASLWSGFGPLLTFSVLVLSYALSARACVAWARPCIWACIALAAFGTGVAIWRLLRVREGLSRNLCLASVGLQAFCLCVLTGFAIATATVVRCG